MSDFLSSLCRTCMSTHANINVGTNTTIRNPNPGGGGNNNSPTIMDLLRWIQPQIHHPDHIQEDKLPKMMCLGCVEQLQTTYEFLKMCKDTDQKFRKLMQEEDFVDDDQILDYPKDLEQTMQIVGDKREEHIVGTGYESQIEKFKIEIYDDDPNYQQTDFEETFMYNRSGGGGQDEFDISHNPFVGNYDDETITSRQEYILDHSSRKNPKIRATKGEIPLSGPHFFREGRGKVFQRSRTLKKRELVHSARTNRMQNTSKNKRKEKVTNFMIGQELKNFGVSAADVVYEQNSPITRRPISIGPTCSSPACLRCKLRHCEEFTEEIRSNIFQNFWSMTDAAKRMFVRDHVILVAKKRIPVENSRKQNTFVFKLPYEHMSLQVCRTMFLSTLSISKNLFRAWMIEDKVIPSNNSKKYD